MKKTIVLFLALMNFSAFSQELTCLNKLLPFNKYSGLHQVLKEEYWDGKDILDSAAAKAALSYLIDSKLVCMTGEMVITVEPVCQQANPHYIQSNTCFIFTNLGYFIASKDNGRNTNFIFSKDKLFSGPKSNQE